VRDGPRLMPAQFELADRALLNPGRLRQCRLRESRRVPQRSQSLRKADVWKPGQTAPAQQLGHAGRTAGGSQRRPTLTTDDRTARQRPSLDRFVHRLA